MVKVLLGLLLIVSFYGCATAPNLNTVSLGMTKVDVLKTLANPTSVSAKDNTEYLRYEDNSFGTNFRRQNDQMPTPVPEYFVRLVNGRIESYGKVGHFNSTCKSI